MNRDQLYEQVWALRILARSSAGSILDAARVEQRAGLDADEDVAYTAYVGAMERLDTAITALAKPEGDVQP
jgi:hypothetical protein